MALNCHMPDYLKNLTEVEEMLIAKSQPFGKVRKLGGDSINYWHIGGHVIIVPEKVFTIYSVLPSRALSLPEVIKVIWVGKDQPTYKNLKPYLEVRREVVRQALLGLKANNPVYTDVTVDEEFLGEWPEAFIPEELTKSMTIIKDVEGEVEEREGYDNARAEGEEETGNEDEDGSDDGDCDNLLVVNSEHEEASEDEEKEILRESIRGGTEHMEGLISDLTQKYGGGSVLSKVDGSVVEQCLVADMIGASLEEDQNFVEKM